MSGNKKWGGDGADRSHDAEGRKGTYKDFPENKKDMLPEKYLSQAAPHAPIASSIPYLLDDAKRISQDSSNLLRQLRRYGIAGGAIGLATLALGIGALLYQGYSLVSDANNYVNTLRKDMDVTERKLDRQTALIEQSTEKVKIIENEIELMKKKLSKK